MRERTDRCAATTTSPETGLRDADTLAALDSWGHSDFSVRAEVVRCRDIAHWRHGEAALMQLPFPLAEQPDDG